MPDTLPSLANEKFVSLTTFKKSGEKASTPMWLARDGDTLVMWSLADSWKVKRIRRDSRVELTPCGRTGKIAPSASTTPGSATIDPDPAETARTRGLIKAKYGLQFHVITFIERFLARGAQGRVTVRITL